MGNKKAANQIGSPLNIFNQQQAAVAVVGGAFYGVNVSGGISGPGGGVSVGGASVGFTVGF